METLPGPVLQSTQDAPRKIRGALRGRDPGAPPSKERWVLPAKYAGRFAVATGGFPAKNPAQDAGRFAAREASHSPTRIPEKGFKGLRYA